MLPPGIGFNAISPRALAASKSAKLPRAFFGWDEIVEMNRDGYWPYTPNTNLLYGLSEALDMIQGKGSKRCSTAISAGPKACAQRSMRGGLPIQCADASVYSPVLTGVIMPQGVDADAMRRLIYERFDLSLGTGLGKVKGRMFRIGHLGDSNDLTLIAAVAGCEMGMRLAGVKLADSGTQAAMTYFASHPAPAVLRKVA
jgi:alanine-glyoxylate transaminase/serine-glyoxylate transaminase/serine-pyruvate transaminase